MKSPASKTQTDGPTSTSMAAGIVAMGLLALFAWTTVPQAPLGILLAGESTALAIGATAQLVTAENIPSR